MKVLALDWGHTLMDERRDRHVPLDDRPAHLMPGVREALAAIALPLAVWANTREGDERHVRAWLRGPASTALHLGDHPRRRRRPQAVARASSPTRWPAAAARPDDVLFVGNQLNTDVAGANAAGIRSVWLAGEAYRSDDDRPCTRCRPTRFESLTELPALVRWLLQQP